MNQTDLVMVIIFSGLAGLIAGSFTNVLIVRTHREMAWWCGRSKCMTCGHQLAWYDNIPLLSFVILRGKCRHCAKTFSWQYPLIELLTAALFILTSLHFGFQASIIFAWIVCVIMVAIAVYDARWSLLPDNFSLALGIMGGMVAVYRGLFWLEVGLGAVLGVAIFGGQYVLSRGRWVGSGDIFLGGALGLLLGWRMFGLSLFISYLVGAMVASVLLLTKKQRSNSAIPFGPYLVLGGFIAWLYGEQIITWYFNHAIFR